MKVVKERQVTDTFFYKLGWLLRQMFYIIGHDESHNDGAI
jgi:hypothetical protein